MQASAATGPPPARCTPSPRRPSLLYPKPERGEQKRRAPAGGKPGMSSPRGAEPSTSSPWPPPRTSPRAGRAGQRPTPELCRCKVWRGLCLAVGSTPRSSLLLPRITHMSALSVAVSSAKACGAERSPRCQPPQQGPVPPPAPMPLELTIKAPSPWGRAGSQPQPFLCPILAPSTRQSCHAPRNWGPSLRLERASASRTCCGLFHPTAPGIWEQLQHPQLLPLLRALQPQGPNTTREIPQKDAREQPATRRGGLFPAK